MPVNKSQRVQSWRKKKSQLNWVRGSNNHFKWICESCRRQTIISCWELVRRSQNIHASTSNKRVPPTSNTWYSARKVSECSCQLAARFGTRLSTRIQAIWHVRRWNVFISQVSWSPCSICLRRPNRPQCYADPNLLLVCSPKTSTAFFLSSKNVQ